jgi:hypothetical protein
MTKHVVRRTRKGQALIVIAGALVALIALVALAVDGGNAYAQRRIAQNAADGAAQAGTVALRDAFLQNLYSCDKTVTTDDVRCKAADQGNFVAPLNSTQDAKVLAAVQSALTAAGDSVANGLSGREAGFTAKYLDASGLPYTGPIYDANGNVTQQNNGSAGQIGLGQAFPFASGASPDAYGVQGVAVQTQSSSGTYFARLIGQNTVTAGATGSGALRAPVSLDNLSKPVPPPGNGNPSPPDSSTAGRLWPLVVMKDKLNTSLQMGTSTTLYAFGNTYTPGNWGELCYDDDNCGQKDTNNWYKDGFNPATGTMLAHDVGTSPNTTPGVHGKQNFLPLGWDGWDHNTAGTWINAKTGNGVSSECHDVFPTAVSQHWTVLIPIADYDNNANGSKLMYHVINVAAFRIESITCPGNNNAITGKFVGYGFSAGQASWTNNLNNAVKTGEVGLALR